MALSSRGLGRRPLTAVTPVRIRLGLPFSETFEKASSAVRRDGEDAVACVSFKSGARNTATRVLFFQLVNDHAKFAKYEIKYCRLRRWYDFERTFTIKERLQP